MLEIIKNKTMSPFHKELYLLDDTIQEMIGIARSIKDKQTRIKATDRINALQQVQKAFKKTLQEREYAVIIARSMFKTAKKALIEIEKNRNKI